MPTQCTQKSFAFHALGNRGVVAQFDGGRITSDAGGLLLREVERKLGVLRQLAACFNDHRDPDLIEHSVLELISQRVYALALGYEDLNDHDELRHDPLLAVLIGKDDPTGMDRQLARDRGKACAGKSTLNRLELTPVGATQPTATRRSSLIRRPSSGCSSMRFCKASIALRGRSCWTWMPPTTLCMAISWGVFFTVTMAIIVICRCISLPATNCCAPSCGPATSTLAAAACRNWSGSWARFAAAGHGCGLSCEPTAASAARTSWPGASGIGSTTCWAWPKTSG